VRTGFAAVIILFTLSIAAQPVTVGVQIVDQGGTATITTGAPATYVNLANTAPVAGTINRASVGWSGSCSNAFKIVILRQAFLSVAAFQVVATRGPFNAVAGRNDVTLSPAVNVQVGDLIGVVQLQSNSVCGSILTQSFGNNGSGYTLITTADMGVTGGTIGSSSAYSSGLVVGAVAYNSDPLLVKIIPAAGAVAGATAFFRTSLQLMNPTSTPITGKLVFHKVATSASAGDPSLAFTIPSRQTTSFSDVITTMGASGLGSLDIVSNGGAVPIASARVFSDGGALGTSGFSEEGLAPNDALDFFSRGILLTPADLTNFRMNIGVRTLDNGATLDIGVYDAGGTLRATRTGVSFPANYFRQFSVEEFTGASTIPANGWILVNITTFTGRAFVYSSIIDNKTSDSTFRMADIR
jgi:hypothetical protein